MAMGNPPISYCTRYVLDTKRFQPFLPHMESVSLLLPCLGVQEMHPRWPGGQFSGLAYTVSAWVKELGLL